MITGELFLKGDDENARMSWIKEVGGDKCRRIWQLNLGLV